MTYSESEISTWRHVKVCIYAAFNFHTFREKYCTFLLHFIIIILSLIKLTGYFTSQALTYKPHDQFTGLY